MLGHYFLNGEGVDWCLLQSIYQLLYQWPLLVRGKFQRKARIMCFLNFPSSDSMVKEFEENFVYTSNDTTNQCR